MITGAGRGAIECFNRQGKHELVAPISLCVGVGVGVGVGGCECTRVHDSALAGTLRLTRGAPRIIGG